MKISYLITRGVRESLRKLIYLSGGHRLLLSILVENKVIRAIVNMIQEKSGYLQQTGWIRALLEQRTINARGEDIPWLTYSCIDFLDERLQRSFHLFEFGCGSSTRYYARRVSSVDAVEYDNERVPKLTEEEKKKVQVYLISSDQKERYTNILDQIEKKYQIIIVDGDHKVSCIRSAVEYLTEDGVLVLNDSHSQKYVEGKFFMKDKGFRHLDFCGLKALRYDFSSTTIFYRPGNCMQI